MSDDVMEMKPRAAVRDWLDAPNGSTWLVDHVLDDKDAEPILCQVSTRAIGDVQYIGVPTFYDMMGEVFDTVDSENIANARRIRITFEDGTEVDMDKVLFGIFLS